MQVFGLPKQVIRPALAASRLLCAKPPNSEAQRRRDVLKRWREAMAHGLTAGQAARAVGASRSSLYRWRKRAEPCSRRPHRVRPRLWSPALAQAVERLRRDNPMWGKGKLAVLLKREGLRASISTVGRILRALVERGAVTPVPILRRRPQTRRFHLTMGQRYARRLPKGMKPSAPGEIVQIDTLFVNPTPWRKVKHFTAYDPVAKWTLGLVAGRATALCAKAMLDKLLKEAPFPIRGVQVDGGSEFKAAFEQHCAEKGLKLFTLPPRRPDLNGCVERAQGSWRYEFYACHELPDRLDKLQKLVDAFAHHFNHQRPHQALGGLTPAEYLKLTSSRDPTASHMC